MSAITIRHLRPDEIECRVQSVKKTNNGVGCILLLYKDARCDMRILDETFGITGWQRSHDIINGNLFCTVEIYDAEKQMWIKKQDVGVESSAEKEKGQASDSFKRACFNIGIGRELYTAPFIWINLSSDEITEYNGKASLSARVKFSVKDIVIDDKKEITHLVIVDQKGVERYPTNNKASNSQPSQKEQSKAPTNKTTPQAPGELVLQTINAVSSEEEMEQLVNGDYLIYKGNVIFNRAVTTRLKEIQNEPAKV